MTLLSLAERIVAGVWRAHFRIPRAAYVLLLAASGMSLLLLHGPSDLGVASFAAALAIQGLFRWYWHRERSRLLVVCLFSTEQGREGRAVRVQELVMTTLRDHLSPVEARLAHAGLGCYLLVHGRIDERPGGGYAVFARVLQPVDRAVTHYDWHTRDRTPARARWEPLVELLTPTPEVEAEEYPLEFASELRAIVRGLAGQIALAVEAFDRAEALLRAAIGVSPQSTSHQIDRLRADLALALAEQGGREEALTLLRERAAGASPSPHLLRTLGGTAQPEITSARRTCALHREQQRLETGTCAAWI
jgi:hypothetical protein